MKQNLNISAIIVVNGISYSKYVLEQVLKNKVFRFVGHQYGGYEAQLHDTLYCIPQYDSPDEYIQEVVYSSSWEMVAKVANLSIWEVALRYINGEHLVVTEGRFYGSRNDERIVSWER